MKTTSTSEREKLALKWAALNKALNNEKTYTPELEAEMIALEAKIWELNLIETSNIVG